MSLHRWKFTNIAWKFFLFYLIRVILLYTISFRIVVIVYYSLPFDITENRSVCLHCLSSIMTGYSMRIFPHELTMSVGTENTFLASIHRAFLSGFKQFSETGFN